MSQFLTIREAARRGPISENFLRGMVKRGECPGLQSGNRFLVNYEQLLERLEVLSGEAVKK